MLTNKSFQKAFSKFQFKKKGLKYNSGPKLVQNKRIVYTSKGNDIDKKYRTGSRLKLVAFARCSPVPTL